MADFNVKTGYGAKGDGITDDSSAVATAIAAAVTAGTGSRVVFPPGAYLIKSSMTIATGVTIVGEGAAVEMTSLNTGTDPIDVAPASVTGKSEEFPS